MRQSDSSVRVESVSAGYDRRRALNDVRVHVSNGEMVGIIGPNGSGKSTLLKVIGRLLSPKSGAVYLGNTPLTEFSTVKIAQRMSALPQAPPTPQELTVRELVGYGRYPHVSWLRRFADQDRDIIENTIRTCRIGDLADRKLSTLSGGERQKAWIAMALAQQPRVMLLDEPVTFLDVSHQLEVMDLVADLNRSQGITVIAVLHDLNLAARYCPRLIALKRGRVYSDGDAVDVIQPDVMRAVFGIGARIGTDPLTNRPVCFPYRLDNEEE